MEQMFRLLGESLIYSFLPFISRQQCKKFVQNEKQKNTCLWKTSVSVIFVLNKITAPIFQIIHIRNKTLYLCINSERGLEQKHKVQTRLQGLLLFDINVKEKNLCERGCIRS